MDVFSEVIRILETSQRLFFVTGAGISADSGLPTYRGIGGLYNDRTTDDGISVETAISGEMMTLNPALPWKYLLQIEEACRATTYNRAHEVIAEMADEFDHVCVLTQNIDGFHQQAGAKNVIDIHGGLYDLYCVECDYTITVGDYGELDAIPPRCPDCGEIIRPEVVLFGEQLPVDRCERLMNEWRTPFDIVFSIGTTNVFPYISQPVMYAKHNGIPTVEINPGITQVSDVVDYRFSAGAAETLDRLWTEYRTR